MTKELYRLPLLWIAPERRCLLQKRMCKFERCFISSPPHPLPFGADVEKNALEKYIEGFNYVYQFYDKSIGHEINFGTTLARDCRTDRITERDSRMVIP